VTVIHPILAMIIDEGRGYLVEMMVDVFRIGLIIAVKQVSSLSSVSSPLHTTSLPYSGQMGE
jgi:hypothetical protein